MIKVRRPIRIDGDVCYVPLTKGYEAILDASDAHIVDGFNWQVNIMKAKKHPLIYAQRQVGRRTIMMHRSIMAPESDLFVDHRDGNGLNNRRSNLRLVTQSQNLCNQRLSSTNTSGFKGVFWSEYVGKRYVQIELNGKKKCLGHYADIQDTAAAYAKASKDLHGEFGRIS